MNRFLVDTQRRSAGGGAHRSTDAVGRGRQRAQVAGELLEGLARGMLGFEPENGTHPARIETAPVGQEDQLLGGEVGQAAAFDEIADHAGGRERHGQDGPTGDGCALQNGEET